MLNPDQILRQGYVDVKVYVSGLRQSHRLEVVKEKTPSGEVPFLVSKYYIPTAELVRLASELNLPIRHKDTIVLPRGKSPSDFALDKVQKKESLAKVEPQNVEAEVED